MSMMYYFQITCVQLDDDKDPIRALLDREGLCVDDGKEIDSLEAFGDVVLSGGFTPEEWLPALLAEIRKHAGPQAHLRASYYCYDTIPRESWASNKEVADE